MAEPKRESAPPDVEKKHILFPTWDEAAGKVQHALLEVEGDFSGKCEDNRGWVGYTASYATDGGRHHVTIAELKKSVCALASVHATQGEKRVPLAVFPSRSAAELHVRDRNLPEVRRASWRHTNGVFEEVEE